MCFSMLDQVNSLMKGNFQMVNDFHENNKLANYNGVDSFKAIKIPT